MEAKLFKNFSTEDFTWKHNGVAHTFKAGMEIYMEDFKADHFAKHLVDREMNREKIVTDNKVDRARLEALCFPSAEVVTPSEALNIEEKKKVVKKKKVEEEEFADLNENE